MAIEIKAPVFPESVADGQIATWHKAPGQPVKRDELLVDIETDKVVLEIVAPQDGTLSEIIKGEGETVLSQEVIAVFEAGSIDVAVEAEATVTASAASEAPAPAGPAARRAMAELGVSPADVQGSGKGNRLSKEDVLAASASKPAPAASAAPVAATGDLPIGERIERRVPMTRMRARIAERLLDASQGTAMLTTFNEVDMKPIMDLRSQYKDAFLKKHGVKLGFMGLFVKAATEALKRFPVVNASIDGNDVVYHGYTDVGIAVSTEKGLVVPVLRDTDCMGVADVERGIIEYGAKARDGKLAIEEMTGGTFTITNGGTFGSMLSTPIINPPQSAILGMHNIVERAVVVNGEIVIRPMMYLALSYDHRLIDGKDSVQFLVTIKQLLEDPARILLEI